MKLHEIKSSGFYWFFEPGHKPTVVEVVMHLGHPVFTICGIDEVFKSAEQGSFVGPLTPPEIQ